MSQDSPRLAKLKEVFKKAVQEIISEEQAVKSLLQSPTFKDSFFSESTVQMTPDDIKKIFQDIKLRFTEIFKTKIIQNNLDLKLNNLDKDIKEGRMSYKDIRNEGYIKEIFESNIVDKKEEFVKFIENENEECDRMILNSQNEISELQVKLKFLEFENEEYEREYQLLQSEINSVFSN